MNNPSTAIRDFNLSHQGTDDKVTTKSDEWLKKFDSVASNLSNLTIEFQSLLQTSKLEHARACELEKKLKESTEENDLLLQQLLLTQEELEQTITQNKELATDIVNPYKKVLMQTLHELPDYWCFDNLETKKQSCSDQEFIEWNFTDVVISGKLHSSLNFKTTLDDGIAGITLQRNSQTSPLSRWPSAFSQADELPIILANERSGHAAKIILNALTPSDWSFLIELVRKLISFLDQPKQNPFEPVENDLLKKGLIRYLSALEKLPATFRYERARLLNQVNRDNYYALDIELESPQLGEHVWPNVRYRIATVEGPLKNFNQHPRLEFHSPCAALSTWFPESSDDQGSRLELRFSAPDLMDTMVLNKLGGKDQILIAALVATASSQLSEMNSGIEANKIQITSWLTVCETMLNIFTTTIARTKSR